MTPSSRSGFVSSSNFRPQKLPVDASTLALGPDPCHCVADAELENRYNVLRAEEHARTEGKCGPEWSCDVAHLPENADRNRYASVVPWDHSRVLLPVNPGENDYINASWVELGSRTYIATQGPLNSTVSDFWHMVYAYGGEPAVIIMLTPLYEHAVEKCAKYWPDSKSIPIECSAERGYPFGLTVHLRSQHTSEQYQLCTFSLQPSSPKYPTRTVHHVYYHSWLDYSKPDADADLRSLIHLVNNGLRNRSCPPIVHCSAGIGRTGTFIALDALLSRIDTDILPAVMPRIVPIWKAEQHKLQYRDSLFTGLEDRHSEPSGSSPRLSKFDVAEASRAPSLMSVAVQSTVPTISTPEPTAASSATTTPSPETQRDIISADKKHQPSLQSRESRLSKALAQSKLGNVDEEGPVLADPRFVDAPQQNGHQNVDQMQNGHQMQNGDQVQNGDQMQNGYQKDVQNGEADKTDTCECVPSSGVENSKTDTNEDSFVDAKEPTSRSSALQGPVIRKVAAKVTSVSPEVFSQTPAKVDVVDWFDPQDPVMSSIRLLRLQRPKMVQGKQQLGYIYDQFEVGQQLARATHQHNLLRRRSTVSSISSSPIVGSAQSTASSRSKPRRILSMIGVKHHSPQGNDAAPVYGSSTSSSTSSRRRKLFSGSVLR